MTLGITPLTSSRIEIEGYFSSGELSDNIERPSTGEGWWFLIIGSTKSFSTPNKEENRPETINLSIPGFESISLVCNRAEQRICTVIGTTSTDVLKRLRFAPGAHGLARHRLIHENIVLDILKDYGCTRILQPEKVEVLSDRSICAIYPFTPAKRFQEYLDEITEMEWWLKLGEILKFAHSLAQMLSEVHLAGVFRMAHLWLPKR
jgi:hypothetical protein